MPDSVTAAFRPEHVRRVREAEDDVELACIAVAAEPLGAETHITVDAGGVTVRAKTRGFDAPERGSSLVLFVPPSSLLHFDAETGARISIA